MGAREHGLILQKLMLVLQPHMTSKLRYPKFDEPEIWLDRTWESYRTAVTLPATEALGMVAMAILKKEETFSFAWDPGHTMPVTH